MILTKDFFYKAPNGKVEVLSGKVSPSNLKRAGVASKLIDAYTKAVSYLNVVTSYQEERAVVVSFADNQLAYSQAMVARDQAQDRIEAYLADRSI